MLRGFVTVIMLCHVVMVWWQQHDVSLQPKYVDDDDDSGCVSIREMEKLNLSSYFRFSRSVSGLKSVSPTLYFCYLY